MTMRPRRQIVGSNNRPAISFMVPVLNRPQRTRHCLESLNRQIGVSFEILVVDNGSDPHTKRMLDVMERTIAGMRVFHSAKNLGYAGGINLLCTKARGDYLCPITNDTALGTEAAVRMVAALADPKVGQVAPPQIFGYLNDDGLGGPKSNVPTKHKRQVGSPEYLDGCCYVVRRDVLVEGHLFPPCFEFMYCEDADLSLRIRSRGQKLLCLPIQFHRDESEKTKCNEDIEYFHRKNRQTLVSRWGNYLKHRMDPPVFGPTPDWEESFVPRSSNDKVYHLIRTGARGDALMLTPVARALKARDPKCRVEIWTQSPDLLASQYVDAVHCPERWPQDMTQIRGTPGHEVYDLNLAYEYKPTMNAAKAYGEAVGVNVEDTRPDIRITGEQIMKAKALLGSNKPFVIFDMGTTWKNREWPIKNYQGVFNYCRRRGLEPVVVGVGRPVPDNVRHVQAESMFDLVPLFAFASAFVGNDSAWMHVAQALGTPSVLLFSVAKPETRIVIDDNVKVVQRDDLPCIHCLQKRSAPRQFTPCDNGAFAGVTVVENECMNIPQNAVVGALDMLLNRADKA